MKISKQTNSKLITKGKLDFHKVKTKQVTNKKMCSRMWPLTCTGNIRTTSRIIKDWKENQVCFTDSQLKRKKNLVWRCHRWEEKEHFMKQIWQAFNKCFIFSQHLSYTYNKVIRITTGIQDLCWKFIYTHAHNLKNISFYASDNLLDKYLCKMKIEIKIYISDVSSVVMTN